MTLHGVERMLYELNRDPQKVGRFRSAPDDVLSEYDLSDTEQHLLRARDVLGLYRLGVHPLLLAPASRFFEIDQRAFRALLAPAVGERVR
jgi:hypothetical protein